MRKPKLTTEEKFAQQEQVKLDKFKVKPWLALAAATDEETRYFRPMLTWGHTQEVEGKRVALAADLYALHLEWLKADEFPEEWIKFDHSAELGSLAKYPDCSRFATQQGDEILVNPDHLITALKLAEQVLKQDEDTAWNVRLYQIRGLLEVSVFHEQPLVDFSCSTVLKSEGVHKGGDWMYNVHYLLNALKPWVGFQQVRLSFKDKMLGIGIQGVRQSWTMAMEKPE